MKGEEYAVEHYSNSLSIFVVDIVIKDNCNENSNSYSRLGWTYDSMGMDEYSDEATVSNVSAFTE